MSKIFWVEDDDEHFELFSNYLKQGNEIVRVSTYEDAIAKLNSTDYDIIIIDILISSGRKLDDLSMIDKINEKYFGIEVITELMSKYKGRMMVLTIVNAEQILGTIRQLDENIPVVKKYESSPKEFASLVNQFVGSIKA